MTESGRCQCGEIEYSFERNKIISGHHCHCKDCQRATGSGKATILVISKKNLSISGEPKYFESVGNQGMHINRGFCEKCGSGILSFAKELDRVIFIKAGTLDDSSWVTIDSNYFTESADDWNKPNDHIKSFNQNPNLFENIKTVLKSFM